MPVEFSVPNNARRRYLEVEEFSRILEAAQDRGNDDLVMFLKLGVGTCVRGIHLMALRWDQIDFEAELIHFPHTAGNKRLSPKPLVGELKAFMMRRKMQAKHAFVFAHDDGSQILKLRKGWETAVAQSGVEDVTIHDLRRTGASWMLQNGGTFDEVACYLDDSIEVVQKHYAIFASGYLRKGAELLQSAKFQGGGPRLAIVNGAAS